MNSPEPGPGEGAFDPVAVARQILAAERNVSIPARFPLQESLPEGFGPPPVPPQTLSAVLTGHVTARGLLPDSLSDRGNAKLFVRLYGGDYRYVPGLGWYSRSGHRWEIDETDTVLWAAGEMAENLSVHDPSGACTTSELARHRRRGLSTAGMNAMLEQAKAAPGMVLHASMLDADPYALCTPGGVVDLRTGLLTPPPRPASVTRGPPPLPPRRWRSRGGGSSLPPPTPARPGVRCRRDGAR